MRSAVQLQRGLINVLTDGDRGHYNTALVFQAGYRLSR